MAFHEMRHIITGVLWNFGLSLMKESQDWSEQNACTPPGKGPLMVKLTPTEVQKSQLPVCHDRPDDFFN